MENGKLRSGSLQPIWNDENIEWRAWHVRLAATLLGQFTLVSWPHCGFCRYKFNRSLLHGTYIANRANQEPDARLLSRLQNRDTVFVMSDTKRLMELALRGLEAERERVQKEIADLESQIHRFGGRLARRARILIHSTSEEGSRKTASKAPKKRRLSAAARKKLSDSAKRRWIASKKAGRSTL